ncbi:unnamed protein product [Absidia cylindrospora]
MSVNSRYRERKYNSSENDRLLRILSQPVQSWEKKWAPSSQSKSHHIHKWVKSDRTIVFEDEEDDEEDKEDKDQVMTEADKDTPLATSHDNTPTTKELEGNLTTTTESAPVNGQKMILIANTDDNTSGLQNSGLFTARSPPTNKQVSSTVADEERTHTPKLSDVPDVDPDQLMVDNDDDKESNTDDLNDASRHPAFAPHIHPRLTDDTILGTNSQSEQTSAEGTPKETGDFPIATTMSDDPFTDTTIDEKTTTEPNETDISNIEATIATDTTLPTAPASDTDETRIAAASPKLTPTMVTSDENTTGNVDDSTSPHVTTQSSSSPTVTTSAAAIENEPSLLTPQQQPQNPVEQQHKGTMEIDDRLLDAPVKTPDVVFSTNTPGVDTPFDTATPSDMPMQRNVNVVTENDTDMDITPTDPQANDEPPQ